MTSRLRNPSGFLSCWILLACLLVSPARGQQDLPLLEEQAMKAAVEAVAGSVVSIETVGGLESAGDVLFGTGPTTGLVVSEEGHIITSAFNFAQKPTSILVGLPDGTRLPAQLVSADRNRMLVLLKVSPKEPLSVPPAVAQSEMMVGQWAIAVGRAFDGSQPNISVGIISAVGRIWGKAVQTDAKVSPANYGGPLVDIHGRVLGVLVPLSPSESGEVAGVEWYDSGIGFAVPLEHINQVLPRLKAGEELKPGLMGISLAGTDTYGQPAVIAACRPNSPAYDAGLKQGDRIVAVDGQPIERQAQLLYEINRRYAGDTIKLAVQRGDEQIEQSLKLVDQLEPYQRPFLGILPVRPSGARAAVQAAAQPVDGGQAPPAGVGVRYVYPDSPAAAAGIEIGDTIVGLAGKPIAGRDELVQAIAALKIDQRLRLSLRRGGEAIEIEIQLAGEPDTIAEQSLRAATAPAPGAPAADAPAADAADAPPAATEAEPKPQTGVIALKVPQFKNECLAYIPESYDASRPCGLVVWLHGAGGSNDDALLARWRTACDEQQLILLAPKAAEGPRWAREDLDFTRQAIDQLRQTYLVDGMRVAALGQQAGGAVAYVLAFSHRDLVRGVAAIDAPLMAIPPDNDPVYRLAFYLGKITGSSNAPVVDAAAALLRERKYSVALVEFAQAEPMPGIFTDEHFAALLRWLDSLDRI